MLRILAGVCAYGVAMTVALSQSEELDVEVQAFEDGAYLAYFNAEGCGEPIECAVAVLRCSDERFSVSVPALSRQELALWFASGREASLSREGGFQAELRLEEVGLSPMDGLWVATLVSDDSTWMLQSLPTILMAQSLDSASMILRYGEKELDLPLGGYEELLDQFIDHCISIWSR